MRVDATVKSAGTQLHPSALGQGGDRYVSLAELRAAQGTLNALLSRENRLQLASGNLLSAVGHLETAGIGSRATPLLKEIQNLTRIRRSVGRKVARMEELLHHAGERELSADERAELLAVVNPAGELESTAA